MARQVKPEEYAARRSEILTAALGLIREKGYEAMSIADLLGVLDISKGAFYHYFDSKRALLDGIVELLNASASQTIEQVMADPALDALGRLRLYVLSAVDWKVSRRDDLSAIARIWRDENNAVLRLRLAESTAATLVPMLTAVIRQGRAEGVFDAGHPEEAATIIAGMGLNLADALVDAFSDPAAGERRKTLVEAHLEALERILGAPSGSVTALAPRVAGADFLGG
ncbi:TetR/AcrR family transcriptional regulator [Flindersiella endophytica]